MKHKPSTVVQRAQVCPRVQVGSADTGGLGMILQRFRLISSSGRNH